MPITITALSTVSLIAFILSLPLSSIASPTEVALQSCQRRVLEELPGTEGQFELNPELPNRTVLIRWQADVGIAGYCRINVEDGAMIEFTNPYAAPRGQRPIENVLAFQTTDYTVRIVQMSDQLYMNVYNRRTKRVELNRGLAYSTNSEEGTAYMNVTGARIYRSIVNTDGRYRLVILAGDISVYDEVGSSLTSSQSSSPPLLPTSGTSPQN